MPWGCRVASLLFQLRFASDPESFGRLLYGVFLLQGVTDLPPTPVTPRNTREIDRLPKGYGREFGLAARTVARKFLSNESDVDELLSMVAIKALSDATLHRAITGKPLSEARSYVFRTVANLARDVLRSQKVRKHDVLDDVVTDPTSWSALGDLIPEQEKSRIMESLERSVSPNLAPDLPMYFSLLMDGFSNKEIAERQMLPSLKDKPISQQMLARYRDRLKAVLEKHFDVRSSEVRPPIPSRWAAWVAPLSPTL